MLLCLFMVLTGGHCFAIPQSCQNLFELNESYSRIAQWYSPPSVRSSINALGKNSIDPIYLEDKINPQNGWFQIGEILIPNQFFMVARDKLSLDQDVLKRDIQPYYKISEVSKNLVKHDAGGSQALKKIALEYYRANGGLMKLVRIMSYEEKQIWIKSKEFKKNPSGENLLKLLSLDLKEAQEYVESFLQINLTEKNVNDILIKVLSTLGRERNWKNIFLAPKSQLERQFPLSRFTEFHIAADASAVASWFFGIEPTYIEILVPNDMTRLQLLDGLVDD